MTRKFATAVGRLAPAAAELDEEELEKHEALAAELLGQPETRVRVVERADDWYQGFIRLAGSDLPGTGLAALSDRGQAVRATGGGAVVWCSS